jgi:hypothetical protein
MPTPPNRYPGLVEDWIAGLPAAEIAVKHGLTATSVARIAKERGGLPRRGPVSAAYSNVPAWVPKEWRPAYTRLPAEFRATLDVEYGPPANVPEEIKKEWHTYSETDREAIRGTYATA